MSRGRKIAIGVIALLVFLIVISRVDLGGSDRLAPVVTRSPAPSPKPPSPPPAPPPPVTKPPPPPPTPLHGPLPPPLPATAPWSLSLQPAPGVGHPGYGKCDDPSKVTHTYCWDSAWLTSWLRKKGCDTNPSTPDCQAIFVEMEVALDDLNREKDLPPDRQETEVEWIHAGGAWLLALSDALGMLSEWLQDPQNVLMANAGDVNAQIDLAVPISELVTSCDTLETQVGTPPTDRLETIGNRLTEVCGLFRQAGLKTIRGVESLDVDLILGGGRDIEAAGALVEKSAEEIRELEDVGGAANQWVLGPS